MYRQVAVEVRAGYRGKPRQEGLGPAMEDLVWLHLGCVCDLIEKLQYRFEDVTNVRCLRLETPDDIRNSAGAE